LPGPAPLHIKACPVGIGPIWLVWLVWEGPPRPKPLDAPKALVDLLNI